MCNIYLQTFINIVKLLLCLFVKHSDLILGLNTLRNCSLFVAFLKNSNHQIGKFFSSIGNKRYFFALGIGPNFGPK